MATLLTTDPDLAEDVYQETLHRLAMRWSRVDSPKAFCRRVMHNIVIDQARAQQRRPRELFAVHDRGDPLVGPQLRSALYKVLADTPGVRVDSHARGDLGRPAVEISRTAA